MAAGAAISNSTATSVDSVVTQAVVVSSSSSKQRARPGFAWTWTFDALLCHGIEHNTPSSGATNATMCQRPSISAAARPAAAQVAIALVNREVPQRNSMSVRRAYVPPSAISLTSTVRPRDRQAGQQLLNDIGAVNAAHPHLRPQADPVCDRRDGECLDVLGYHIVATAQQCAGAGELHQVELGPGAGPDRDLRMVSRGRRERDHVVQYVLVHRDLLDGLAHPEEIVCVHDAVHFRLRRTSFQPPAQHRRLVLLR